MPVPARVHAISEPATPVSAANVPGSEKTPAPIIEPTTNVDNVRVETFVTGAVVGAAIGGAFWDGV